MSSIAKATGGVMLVVGTLVITLVAAIIGISVVIVTMFSSTAPSDSAVGSCVGTSVDLAASAGARLTVKGDPITPEQSQNAAIVTEEALDNDLPAQAAVVAIMTAMQESTLINVPYGDRDSLGVFQQRDNWGSRRARMNPATSAHMFYFGGRKGYSEPGLTDIAGWQQMPPGDAAQAVQVSAFPDAYATHEAEAKAIVEALTGEDTSTGSDCPSTNPIELAVRAALSRQGDQYEWPDGDGSGLTSWAFGEAGVSVPGTRAELSQFDGDPGNGVSASAVDIASAENLKRGDVVVWKDKDSGALKVGMDLGDVSDAGTVRFASFNIKGGFRGSDWENRLRRTTDLLMSETRPIDVAGLQELKQNQRALFLTKAFGGERYDMYPARFKGKSANYVSENSIIWDKSKFSLVSAEEILFMRNYEGADRKIPQLLLEVKATGQRFYVLNTHDPAFASGAARRYANAKFYRSHLKTLASEGLPIVFTGDFNAGYKLKDRGNVTLDDDINKLTYCVLTSGVVWDTFDAVKGDTGVCPSRNGGAVDHIFVSRTLSVSSHEKSGVGYMVNGSDHPMISADVVLLGSLPEEAQANSSARSVITADEGLVATVKVRPVELVSAIRLGVSNSLSVVSYDGEWSLPMKRGTYNPPQSSAGRYGFRVHPVTLLPDFHNGVDLGADTGDDLFSIGGGEVVRAEYHSCWGNLVVIDHGEVLSMYTHLSQFASGLSIGDAVQAGQQIGDVGNTGYCTTGSHLHFTVGTSLEILSGDQAGSIDPEKFMAAQGVPLF